LVARLISLALVLGALNLVSLGLSTLSAAQAASVNGTLPSSVIKRHQFRPLANAADQPGTLSQPASIGASDRSGRVTGTRRPLFSGAQRRAQEAMIFDRRAGARKAVPVTRGQELGLRFRPDENASPYTQQAPTALQRGTLQPEMQSQFRPLAPKRKPTYEELQAESDPQALPAMPAMPYPPMPGPMVPNFGGPWPRF